MALSNNPLKQYFRRPSIYLKLPSGGNYPAGVINQTETGELPVYPMTALDDISIKTPDGLFNGTAVVDIIKSCIPDIINPWAINGTDLDAILIAIRSASGNGELEVETMCPSCSETAKYGINLGQLLVSLKSGNYENELQINELYIKLKPLSYKELNDISTAQFQMQRMFIDIENTNDIEEKNKKGKEALKVVSDVTMNALAKSIEYIKTPSGEVSEHHFILDYLQNCSKEAYESIKEYNAKLKEASDIKPVQIKCPNCSHEYKQELTLNMSDFFG